MYKYLHFIKQCIIDIYILHMEDPYGMFSKIGIWIWRSIMVFPFFAFSIIFIISSPLWYIMVSDTTFIFEDYIDNKLSQKIIKRLLSTPKDEWLSIGHTFNRWEFPIEFYDLIPSWWSKEWDKHLRDRAFRITNSVASEISKEFSTKEQLRFHNVTIGSMTDEQFEYWFGNIRNNPNSSSIYYDRMFNIEKIKWWEDDTYSKIEKLNIFQ